jgi:hypothetical protein
MGQENKSCCSFLTYLRLYYSTYFVLCMRKNLCRANLPPEAMDCALAKGFAKVVFGVVAMALDSCGKDGWFKLTTHQHHLSCTSASGVYGLGYV